ncbi:MAG: DUF1573 domain-containing protein [Flavobacteriales bacterium]|nr:DUF1573 domain-containing protein [Flavobacteriales bacterium]
MKKTLILFAAAFLILACTSNEAVNAEERKVEYAEYIDDPTTISFEQSEYDFGTATDGDMVRHTFKFTNSGDKNLILIDVTGSCGCTVPESWPQHPIAPGEGGEIEVVFNSNNRVGNVRKNIRVEANTDPTLTTLTLTGKVKEKK